jgi:hypothetical protein
MGRRRRIRQCCLPSGTAHPPSILIPSLISLF